MTIKFLSNVDGYALGTQVQTLSTIKEDAYIAAGAATRTLDAKSVLVSPSTAPPNSAWDLSSVIGGNYLGPYTFANLPSAAANSGYWAFCTNFGVDGCLLYSNGVRWKPSGGMVRLKSLETVPTITGASELIFTGAQFTMPAGMWGQGDSILVVSSQSKSAGAGTATFALRLGTAGTIADTMIYGLATAFLATTARTSSAINKWRRTNATTVQKLGAAGVSNGYAGASSTTPHPVAVTVTDMDANSLIFSLSCILTIDTTEVVSLNEFSMFYEASSQ